MEIRYNFPQLLRAADDCSTAMKNMSGELDALEQGLQPLLATWDGDARLAYRRRQDEWNSAAQDLTVLLTRIEKALRESAQKMQMREKANKAKFE
jgi:WXG100 family type VII secretion target